MGRDAIVSQLMPQPHLRGAGSVDAALRHIDLDVAFAFNSATVLPEARRQLEELAAALATPALASSRFEIAGHTDATGTAAVNDRLSRQRAAAVRAYMIAHGVEGARLQATGYGFSRLKDPAHPTDGVNRRVEVINVGGTDTAAPVVDTVSPKPPSTATAANTAVPVQDCDRLAAMADDPGRVAPGVPDDKVDGPAAIAACEQAVSQFPNTPRFAAQLGRVYEVQLAHTFEAVKRVSDVVAIAEPYVKRVLELKEKWRDPDYSAVDTSINNLASLYAVQGQYAEAEPLYKRALTIWDRLDNDHPEFSIVLGNLGTLYYYQGRYAEAEQLHKRALTILENTFGPDHPDLVNILNNLAGLYESQDRYAEAEPLYKRAQTIREKAFGSDHP